MKAQAGRPAKVASALYKSSMNRTKIDQYFLETSKRWTREEIDILVSFENSRTVTELKEMLPGRNDLQIRRMLAFLHSD